ncbi:hypothetical protein C8D84_1112 [Psychrobacter immobilis]|uniref:Uncharacterized protein n=1 Tax=Psychrobacter immobilis TaxID=498 RepID=A0A2V1ZVC1_PSYIM|nr:hypothetical protein [Psychrobacter immobilis]PWK09467.1 hypothetical protein C8D84_1112 [Psychrobacter immobilis]
MRFLDSNHILIVGVGYLVNNNALAHLVHMALWLPPLDKTSLINHRRRLN